MQVFKTCEVLAASCSEDESLSAEILGGLLEVLGYVDHVTSCDTPPLDHVTSCDTPPLDHVTTYCIPAICDYHVETGIFHCDIDSVVSCPDPPMIKWSGHETVRGGVWS